MDGKTKLLGGIFFLIAAFAAYSYFGAQADLNSRAENATYKSIEKRPDITMTIVKTSGAVMNAAISTPQLSGQPSGQPSGQLASQTQAPTQPSVAVAAAAQTPAAQAAQNTCAPVGNSFLSLRTAEHLFRFNLRPGLIPTTPALGKFIGANLKTVSVREVKEEPTDSVYSINANLVAIVQALKTDAQTFNCLEWYLINAADTENCEHLALAQHLSVTNNARGFCIVGTLADVHVYKTPGATAQPILSATVQVQQR